MKMYTTINVTHMKIPDARSTWLMIEKFLA